ncbi:MAG TPA: MaoC family dehydratase N-terminal domain-containing protein [Rhizomicrobium sp.]
MIDKSHIGTVSEARMIDIEKGQLKFFAKATGQTDPIYFDDDAARAAGHPAIPMPPTFAFSLGLGAPPKNGNLFDIIPDLRGILHGEQSFTYHQMLYAGDTATLISTIRDIYEKRNGALEFVVQDTDVKNQHGALCIQMRTVTVVRNMQA